VLPLDSISMVLSSFQWFQKPMLSSWSHGLKSYFFVLDLDSLQLPHSSISMVPKAFSWFFVLMVPKASSWFCLNSPESFLAFVVLSALSFV
jgi:hypothetical protein